jgi:carbonic anhydrase
MILIKASLYKFALNLGKFYSTLTLAFTRNEESKDFVGSGKRATIILGCADEALISPNYTHSNPGNEMKRRVINL